LMLFLVFVLSGGNVGRVLQLLLQQNVAVQQGPQNAPNPQEDQLADFVSVILADTEDVWTALFRQMGRKYTPPELVLFRGTVRSACGFNSAAAGPFYCPGDSKLYIDLAFYEELENR